MKKILIAIIIFILLVLFYLMCFKTFKIGAFKIDSVQDIKQLSANLNGKFDEANTLSKNTYSKKVEDLNTAIKKLTTVINQYKTKVAYNSDGENTIATYLKNYKIETLMVDLGRYKNKNGLVDLRLDLKTNATSQETYDLVLTLVGPYDSIYNFMYDVENDDDLKFQISNLIVEPYMLKTSTTITKNNSSSTKTEMPYSLKETITTSELGEGNSSSSNKNNASANTITDASKTSVITSNKQGENTVAQDSAKVTSASTPTRTDVVYDPKNVQATFTVEGISISFN